MVLAPVGMEGRSVIADLLTLSLTQNLIARWYEGSRMEQSSTAYRIKSSLHGLSEFSPSFSPLTAEMQRFLSVKVFLGHSGHAHRQDLPSIYYNYPTLNASF